MNNFDDLPIEGWREAVDHAKGNESGAATRLAEMAGFLRGSGPGRTIEEMDRAIDDKLRDRHDQGRY